MTASVRTEDDALAELIARLEKATGPDRKIDVAIWELLANPDKYRRASHWPRYSDWESKSSSGAWEPFYPSLNALHYTASIDAALTLVPEPWRLQDIWQSDDGKSWHAGVRIPGLEVGSDEACATPAIALCIAALKARAARPPRSSMGGEP